MEYIYSAMLLHKAGKDLTLENIKKVLEAAGITADEGKIKALVAALDGVNIEEAIKQAAVPVAAAAPTGAGKETKKEEPEEEKKTEEQAAAGLGALFG